MNVSNFKAFLQKSMIVHSAYKLVRDSRDVPIRKWLNIRQLSSIFRVLPNTMLPMPRLFGAYEAIAAINREGIQGDVVECGVWNGGCVGLMGLANLKEPGPKRKFHLFDSFEGLPQPSLRDIDVIDNFKKMHPGLDLRGESGSQLIPIGACVGNSQSSVEKLLVQYLGLNRGDLVFHVGWFQDTIPNAAQTIKDIALLRLDGDWYESTKVCIDGLYHKVVKGGYVIIDDYGTFTGCRKAVDDFFETMGNRPNMSQSDSECVFFRKQ
jgi:O-methyltransferase